MMMHNLYQIKKSKIQYRNKLAGRIEEVFLDRKLLGVRYLSTRLTTGGAQRNTLLPFPLFQSINNKEKILKIGVNDQRTREAPQIMMNDGITRLFEIEINMHYEISPYWETGSYRTPPYPNSETTLITANAEQLNEPAPVTTIKEMTLLADSLPVGSVTGIWADLQAGELHYLTFRNTLRRNTKQNILFPLRAASVIDWFKKQICTDLPAQTILNAPVTSSDNYIYSKKITQVEEYYGSSG